MSPRQQYGTRGQNVTVVTWVDADGTFHVEAYAAAGVRASSHTSATDRKQELVEAEVEEHLITVTTLVVK